MAIRDCQGRVVYRATKPCPVCGNVIPASWTERDCPRHVRRNVGKYSNETMFVEAQAVLAAGQGDDEELESLVRDMMRNERRDLAAACRMVIETCEMVNRGSNRL